MKKLNRDAEAGGMGARKPSSGEIFKQKIDWQEGTVMGGSGRNNF